MSKFDITSSNLINQYNYENENVIVNGGYSSNPTNNELVNINGTAYRKNANGEMGDYIGNFNGNANNGEVLYSLSEMSRNDSELVWDAIEDIESYITGSNSPE